MVIVALAVLGLFFYYYNYNNVQPAESDPLRFGQASFNNGDIDKAIEEFNKVLFQPQSKDVEALAKFYLAYSHIQKSFTKSVGYFKEIASDPSHSNLMRAEAVENMAELYSLAGCSPERAKVIFKGEPYSSFLVEDPDLTICARYRQSINKLYEYALTIYPLFISEYRLSEWNAFVILNSRSKKTKLEKTEAEHLAAAKEHLRLGDDNSARYIASDIPDGDLRVAHYLKGNILGFLYAIEKKSEYLPLAESEFQQALNYGGSGESVFAEVRSARPRFYYAMFLGQAYGKARAEDIEALLKPLAELIATPDFKHNRFYAYLNNLSDRDNYDRKRVLDLAKIYPDFGKALKTIGWKI